jgi:hypothetical protein
MDRDMVFFAITADVISSRAVKKRGNLQKKLNSVCETINNKYKAFIAVKFSITLGDEIQGLLKQTSPVFNIIRDIEEIIYPYQMRFGIGEGTISTELNKTTFQMDGECFLNAREALQNAKKEDRKIKMALLDKNIESALDIILLWLEENMKNWNELIYRRVFLYKKLSSIEKVAKKENVTKQSISKSLKRARYDLVIKSEEVINNLLSTRKG